MPKTPSDLIIDRAKRKAGKSPCRTKVCAVGFDSHGELLGFAYNRPRFRRYGGGIHAEMALLQRYGRKLNEVWVCRVDRRGILLRPIEPCRQCREVLDGLGIKIKIVAEIEHENANRRH